MGGSDSHRAFISIVKNPSWIDDVQFAHPHLFGEALSTLMSFVTLREVKSPRDGYRLNNRQGFIDTSDYRIDEMSMTLPFLASGPGSHYMSVGEDTEDKYVKELQELISLLEDIKDEKLYTFILEVIRLIQLSILVKRDDFGLAYLLLISAIEAVAQKEFKKTKSTPHEKEREWEQKATTDTDFKELLEEFKKLKGKDTLTNKFIRFILRYCPPEEWEKAVIHRDDFMNGNYECVNSFMGIEHPSKMKIEVVEKILKNAYIYRCNFVHQGKQPPHRNHEARHNKFFEILDKDKEDTSTFSDDPANALPFDYELCPTYELMLGLAKDSIFKWIKKKAK